MFFFFKLSSNTKLNTRQFLTQVFTCTCEIICGRGNQTRKPKGRIKVCLYRTRPRMRLGGVREGMV